MYLPRPPRAKNRSESSSDALCAVFPARRIENVRGHARRLLFSDLIPDKNRARTMRHRNYHNRAKLFPFSFETGLSPCAYTYTIEFS